MSSQGYEQISSHDAEDPLGPSPIQSQTRHTVNSAFDSRTIHTHTSPPQRQVLPNDRDPLVSDVNSALDETFNSPSDSESDNGSGDEPWLDDRQRVMSGRTRLVIDHGRHNDLQAEEAPRIEQRTSRMTDSNTALPDSRYGAMSMVHDGVFANLNAKPDRGDDMEEKPPTYEQAAADATPPYWENTIFAPTGTGIDEVYIDGLPVGSFFSFIWNGMISMSFQLVGFLLTYLLHSTHAAKNGSKAGLGITLIQYGFSLKGATSVSNDLGHENSEDSGMNTFASPSDPNNHNFDPNNAIDSSGTPLDDMFTSTTEPATQGGSVISNGFGAMGASDWFAYALMIVGWFVLIRAISEYLKARRHEALVLQSPGRGLNVAVVADGEEPIRSV